MSNVTVVDGTVTVNVSIVDNGATLNTTVVNNNQIVNINPNDNRVNITANIQDNKRTISVTCVDNQRLITISVSPETLAKIYMNQTKIYRDEVIGSSKIIYVSETPPLDPQQDTLWLDISQN